MINNMKVENTQNLTAEGSETDPESLIAYQNLQLTNLFHIFLREGTDSQILRSLLGGK